MLQAIPAHLYSEAPLCDVTNFVIKLKLSLK